MSKTWSYTRVPRSRRSRAAAGRAECRDPWKLTRYPGAPGRFLRRSISHMRTARTMRNCGIYRCPGRGGAAWAVFGGAICVKSRPGWARRRASPAGRVPGAGCRVPGRPDRGPRAALGASRYVSGRARAAGRGKLNAQKKTPGRNPGASCADRIRSAMGVAVGLYPKPYAAPWDHDAVVKRRVLRGATECQIRRLRVLVPVAMVDAEQGDTLGSRQGPH